MRCPQAPFAFQLRLQPPAASHASRRLLDIEKLTIATDASGHVVGEGVWSNHTQPLSLVQMTVHWSGRAPSPEAEAALRAAGVEYIIVCDTLLAPGVPRFVPALLLFLAAVLFVGIRYVVPLIITHARAVNMKAESGASKQR